MREWLSRRWWWLVPLALVGYPAMTFLLIWLVFVSASSPFGEMFFGEAEARKYYDVTQGMTAEDVLWLLDEPRRRYPPGTAREEYHPWRGGPDWSVSEGEIWHYVSPKATGYCYVLFDDSGKVADVFCRVGD
jgi:hypothetical protein